MPEMEMYLIIDIQLFIITDDWCCYFRTSVSKITHHKSNTTKNIGVSTLEFYIAGHYEP
jgi:hypothetical protein